MTLPEFLSLIDRVLHYPLFSIGATPVTLSSLIMFMVALGVFVFVSRLISHMLATKVLTRMKIEEGTRYALERMTQYTLTVVGAIIAFQFIGIDLSGLVVIFGALSVGIGFGLQNLTSNFVAGLILLFQRPIKVGDRVTVGDMEGDVIAINIRSTIVQTLNNLAIIVPNSEFVSSRVVNWSYGDPKIRLDIPVGVSYHSDLDTVLRSLMEVANESSEVLKTPAAEVLHRGFGDSAWNMELRIWVRNPKRHYQLTSEINCAIIRKFKENGVEIPFPQRDLHVRSPLPLPLATADAGKHNGDSG